MAEFLGQFDWVLFVIVLGFMAFDILSGFVAAVINREVSSTAMRVGIFHKFVLVLVIIFAMLCQLAAQRLGLPAGFDALYPSACLLIVTTEIVSVLENIEKTGAIDGDKLDHLFGNLDKGGEDGRDERGN